MSVEVYVGDYIIDGDTLRRVSRLDGDTMYMEDGGVLSRDAVTSDDILLESEVADRAATEEEPMCHSLLLAQEEEEYDDDGQPTEYEEWQDYMGGDDWDHGQFDY